MDDYSAEFDSGFSRILKSHLAIPVSLGVLAIVVAGSGSPKQVQDSGINKPAVRCHHTHCPVRPVDGVLRIQAPKPQN